MATQKMIETIAEKVLDDYVAKAIAKGELKLFKEKPEEKTETIVTEGSKLDKAIQGIKHDKTPRAADKAK